MMNRMGTVALLCATVVCVAGMNAWPAKENRDSEPTHFAVSMIASGGNGHWYGIRYNIKTGQSHEMVRGAWVAIEGGPKRKQRGEYKVEMIQTRTGRYAAVLLNTETGQSWHINDGRWLPVAEE